MQATPVKAVARPQKRAVIARRLPPLVLCLGAMASGCLPAEYPTNWDADGDGYGTIEDCDPDDPLIHPGADDPVGDAIDQNCDGYDGVDSDGDGGAEHVDCDDEDPTIYPGAPDPYGDGIDQDCDECPGDSPDGAGDGIDRDCDGYPANINVDADVQDCDDEDAAIHPDAQEQCNGVDNDCSGTADDLWECDPGNCGEGTWGWLPVDMDTIHVDVEADEGGDGSVSAPFTSIQDGLDTAAAAGGGMVAVAAGSYLENLMLTDEHDGVLLIGRCADLVEVDGSGGAEDVAAVFSASYTGAGHWEVTGVAVRNAPEIGINLYGGDLSLSYVTVDANTKVGIALGSPDSLLSLAHSLVTDSSADADGNYGYGVLVSSGALLDAVGSVIQSNVFAGIVVSDEGSTATLTDVWVDETERPPQATVGEGVVVQQGGTVTATRLSINANEGPGLHVTTDGVLSCTECDLSDNSFAGAVVQGGSLILDDSAVTDPLIDAEIGGGVGLFCDDTLGASSIQVTDCVFYDPAIAAIWIDGPGSYVLGENNIEGGQGGDVLLPDGSSEWFDGAGLVAIGVSAAADLMLQLNEFESAMFAGVLLHGSSATLTDNTYEGNGVDLLWQNCDGVEEPIGYEEAPLLEYCPALEHPVPAMEFQLYPE